VSEPEHVLPLVVRLERATPPTRTAALEAACLATLRMLTTDNPEWVSAVARWEHGRIRKVVRRARGVAWDRAQALEGLTVEHGSAQVRVFPPIPIDSWPPELARLQVEGTDLSDPAAPVPPEGGVPLILLSPRHEMTAGKAMAQAAHAAQLGWWSLGSEGRRVWQGAGFPLAVRAATASQWDAAVAAGAAVVTDGGLTEVEPGARTALFVIDSLTALRPGA